MLLGTHDMLNEDIFIPSATMDANSSGFLLITLLYPIDQGSKSSLILDWFMFLGMHNMLNEDILVPSVTMEGSS